MNEIVGNIWEGDVDCICITTNGTVTSTGHNIMGGGIALEATQRKKSISLTHGTSIRKFGHRFQLLDTWRRPSDGRNIILWAFPTKVNTQSNSDLDTIEDSLTTLAVVAESMGNLTWGLPRPGCNLGGLDWETQVKDLVKEYVDDIPNIVVFHYPQVGVPNG